MSTCSLSEYSRILQSENWKLFRLFLRIFAVKRDYFLWLNNEETLLHSVMIDIPNRKRFLCFHRVMVTRVKFGRTRNAVETRAAIDSSSPKLSQVYHNSMETQGKRFLLFSWNKSTKHFLCFHRVMVNGFEPIKARVVSCLFHKSELCFYPRARPNFSVVRVWKCIQLLYFSEVVNCLLYYRTCDALV